MKKSNVVTKLVRLRQNAKLEMERKLLTKIIALFGLIIPEDVVIGSNVEFAHNAIGSVISHGTVIEDDVMIYQNVTLGRSNPKGGNKVEIIVKKGAIISAGAKCLAKERLVIGENSIIAANAVLLNSTGKYEVWGGVPAKLIKVRNFEEEEGGVDDE